MIKNKNVCTYFMNEISTRNFHNNLVVKGKLEILDNVQTAYVLVMHVFTKNFRRIMLVIVDFVNILIFLRCKKY